MQGPCCIFANMWLAREEKTGRSHARSESYSKGRQSFTKKWSQGPISSLTMPVRYLRDVKTKTKQKKFPLYKVFMFMLSNSVAQSVLRFLLLLFTLYRIRWNVRILDFK